jgi:hypothetical protein
MLVWILLPRTPRSLGAERQQGYRQALRDGARAHYTHEPSDAESLYVRIVWFSRKKGGPDTDNIVKPILDELDGIVYRTDAQIKQCLATRIDLTKPYAISDRNVPDDLYQSLADLINSSHGDILLIEVGELTSQEVVFGEIDRSAI